MANRLEHVCRLLAGLQLDGSPGREAGCHAWGQRFEASWGTRLAFEAPNGYGNVQFSPVDVKTNYRIPSTPIWAKSPEKFRTPLLRRD